MCNPTYIKVSKDFLIVCEETTINFKFRGIKMGSTVTNSVTSLFLILLVGVYGRKKEIINQEINKGLTNILINITLPLLIISSFMIDFDIEMKKNVYQTFFFSLITFGITLIISKVLVIPIKGNKRNILNFSNIFTNTGFIGFPLLNAVLGPEGVVYGSTYNIIFNIFVWTYGLMIYKGRNQASSIKDKVLDIFKQPTIIAVLIGLTIMIFSIKIPPVIFTSIKLVGDITGPLSMIVVGVSLLNINFKNILRTGPYIME